MVNIEKCAFSYANTFVHVLAFAEIDMSIVVTYTRNEEKLIKKSLFQYHSRVDIPYSERALGAPKDRAAVLALDDIIGKLIRDLISDLE